MWTKFFNFWSNNGFFFFEYSDGTIYLNISFLFINIILESLWNLIFSFLIKDYFKEFSIICDFKDGSHVFIDLVKYSTNNHDLYNSIYDLYIEIILTFWTLSPSISIPSSVAPPSWIILSVTGTNCLPLNFYLYSWPPPKLFYDWPPKFPEYLLLPNIPPPAPFSIPTLSFG